MDNPLVQPDPGLFIWTIVTFLVLLALLTKFAWRPLLEALERRREQVRKSLHDAHRAREELQRLQRESEETIRKTRLEAQAILVRGREDGERLREEITRSARAEADTLIRNAQREIQLETDSALRQIRDQAADLSVTIASKLIERNLTSEDNQRLIDEAVRQLASS